MQVETYQLRIDLVHAKPPIWRRVLVPADIKLNDLHRVIQILMPWGDYHLHHFYQKDATFGMPTFYGPNADEMRWDADTKDESLVYLYELLSTEKDKLYYEYDFGDSWEHRVLLEKILAPDAKHALPHCVTGRCACPPEDCGGLWGYYGLLESIQDPTSEEYEDALYTLGVDFDPKFFDKDAVNKALSKAFVS